MAPPPLVFDFTGVVFTAIFYGFYCLVFGLYWRIQLKRPNRWRDMFFYALTINFLLSTAYFVILIIQVQFKITRNVLKTHSFKSADEWLAIANDALYTCIDFISQLVLLYRCWIMWRKPLVMVIPCLVSLAFIVLTLTTLGFGVRYVHLSNADTPAWYFSAVTTFFALSLLVNALVTSLIVYRIVSVFHSIQEFNSSSSNTVGYGQRDLSPIVSILIESGMITFVGQLAQSIMFKTANEIFPLIGGIVVMLFGISMTAVLVRVAMGISYDHNTSRTMNSMNSERPTPLSPFVTKYNQSQAERSNHSLNEHF